MSKVNETGHVNGRLRPLRGFFCFWSFVTERGFRVLSSAKDLYVYENCLFFSFRVYLPLLMVRYKILVM